MGKLEIRRAVPLAVAAGIGREEHGQPLGELFHVLT